MDRGGLEPPTSGVRGQFWSTSKPRLSQGFYRSANTRVAAVSPPCRHVARRRCPIRMGMASTVPAPVGNLSGIRRAGNSFVAVTTGRQRLGLALRITVSSPPRWVRRAFVPFAVSLYQLMGMRFSNRLDTLI